MERTFIGRRPNIIEYGHNCNYDGDPSYLPKKGETVLYCPNGMINLEAVYIGRTKLTYDSYEVIVCEGRLIYVRAFISNVIQRWEDYMDRREAVAAIKAMDLNTLQRLQVVQNLLLDLELDLDTEMLDVAIKAVKEVKERYVDPI